MIVGTAGHIDHGKTALVKALTGVDADRLAEEKARGITIELGFAYTDLGGGAITGFVDVPGHERFVHTMLAGAAGIDAALVVVAADDGVMPQTLEHLAILDLLGLSRGIVAMTKADLADPPRRAEVERQIRAALRPTGLRDVDIIAVSSLTGEGIGTFRQKLVEEEARIRHSAASGRFRMAVDRCFTLVGAGTIVTGTVLSGRVAIGDHVMISPSGIPARIRSLHAQNRAANEGVAGQRCALNITGEEVAKEHIHRGDVICDPVLHAPADRIDATLRLLEGAGIPAAGFPARLHCGSAEVGIRVAPLAAPEQPGGSNLVQLVLDHPIAATIGDRFILRDVSARRTLGGGRFLDLRAPSRKRRAPERLAWIAAQDTADAGLALSRLLETPTGLVDLPVFLRDRALTQAEGQEVLAGADAEMAGPVALSRPGIAALRQQMADHLAAFHADQPEAQGMGREKLRLSLTPRLPKDAFLSFLRDEAKAGRVVLDGAFLRLPGHEVRMSEADEALFTAIAPHLSGEARFRPPRVRDFAGMFAIDEREVRRVLRLCAKLGRVDLIAQDHFFARSTVVEMVGLLQDVAADSPAAGISAAAFRDRMLNGRKVAIEILDFFDRHGVTLRRGDLRRINPHRLDQFGPPPDDKPGEPA